MAHKFHLFDFHHSNDKSKDTLSDLSHQHHHHHHLFHFQRRAPEVEPSSQASDSIAKDAGPIHNDTNSQRRNVFRILETVWVFQVSLVPNYKGDANPDGWATFDDDSQKRLEMAYNNKTWCVLSDTSSIGPGTIHFESDVTYQKEDNSKLFKYKVDINRMSTPLWRFEKVCPQNTHTKQMECFEWKNQVRLEAFDDPNATLMLTDKAFPHPFTVVLNQAQKRNGEQWQGFMYLDSSPTMNATSSYVDEDHYQDVGIQNMNDFPNFNMNSDMERERLDVEHYRKIYANK
ncbi:hypothetical protein K501DRAFT_167147 [Backusella circina FSU 941]|nr:hypothetical protein K501DRAFT_167147 [Backusella circina FSU 941]